MTARQSIVRRARPWPVLVAASLVAASVLAGGVAAQPLGGGGSNVLEGTRGANTLTGTGGNDVMAGLRGNDRLRGRGGDDTLVGGPGRDRLAGGPGDDIINARDGGADRIDCGPGWDTVVADDRDDIPAGCEHANIILVGGPAISDDPIIPRLSVVNLFTNEGSGSTGVAIERPYKEFGRCAALECTWVDIPTNVSVIIEAMGSIGSEPNYGGDCAPFNSGIDPCILSMAQPRAVTITLNGSG